MKKLICLLALCSSAMAVDVEIVSKNWYGTPIRMTLAGNRWNIPVGESRLLVPAGTYELREVDGGSPETLAVTSSDAGGAILHLWQSTNNVSGIGVLMEETDAPMSWFLRGFTLGLTLFGFALVLRIVRNSVNHSPEL